MAPKKQASEDQATRFWTKIGLVAEIAALISNRPLDHKTFKEVLERINEVVAFEHATLYLLNREKAELEDVATYGAKVEPIDFVPFDLGFGFTAWAARQNKPILLSHLNNPDRPPEKQLGSFLVIPLLVQEKMTGVISFGHSRKEFFRDTDVKLLSLLGGQIAVSAERIIYQQELERRNQELIKAQKQLRRAQERLVNDQRLAAVRELSVSVNHEINNPLSVIIGNIQCLMFIEKDLRPEVIARLERVESEAMKIAEINRRLLKIEDLVTETYIEGSSNVRMINLAKSSSGRNDD